jgi:CSLREA domain-containing protein
MVKRVLLGVLLAASAVTLVHAPAAGASVIVDTTSDTFDGSCVDGDCSLRDAVASAGHGGTVRVPAGFYAVTETEAGDLGDGSIEIADDLRIQGIGETGAFIDASALGSSLFRIRGGARVEIDHLTLFGASTDTGGPVAWVTRGAVAFRGVTLTAGVGRAAGAVVVGSRARAMFTGSLLLENRSISGPGAVRATRPGAVVSATDSAFVGNTGERGGAIGGRVGRLVDVTLAHNAADQRGGALWLTGRAELRSVTIARNRAGSGAAIVVARGAWASVGHGIIAGNLSAGGPQCIGSLRSAGWSIDDGDSCGLHRGTDLRRTGPSLGGLTSNGGPTPTMALRAGSPAIDIGGGCGPRDQRGAPRDRSCDTGAYELVRCRGRAVDIVGTPGDDDLTGGRDPDTFLGLGGNDAFQGSLGRDLACGGEGQDHLIGGPGDDVLAGGRGADELDGEGGADRCIGGRGRDEIVACERQPIRLRRDAGQYTATTFAFSSWPVTEPKCRESVEPWPKSPCTHHSSSASTRSPISSPGAPTSRFTIS